MVLTTKSIFCKTILFISLSIISASCASSDSKKLADLERKFKSSVDNKRWKETIVLADMLLKYQPNDPEEVILEKGHALARLRRCEEALVYLNEFLENATSRYWFFGYIFFTKGHCLEDLKRYEDALETYRLAVRHGYDDQEVYSAGDRMLSKLDRLDKEAF